MNTRHTIRGEADQREIRCQLLEVGCWLMEGECYLQDVVASNTVSFIHTATSVIRLILTVFRNLNKIVYVKILLFCIFINYIDIYAF